ncbi:unnamed protein product [Amoebophrya sp. A120]|nr:unnamed protein product [Amoebophrya sp. A120]|eukprot:GSA120T00014250001.1
MSQRGGGCCGRTGGAAGAGTTRLVQLATTKTSFFLFSTLSSVVLLVPVNVHAWSQPGTTKRRNTKFMQRRDEVPVDEHEVQPAEEGTTTRTHQHEDFPQDSTAGADGTLLPGSTSTTGTEEDDVEAKHDAGALDDAVPPARRVAAGAQAGYNFYPKQSLISIPVAAAPARRSSTTSTALLPADTKNHGQSPPLGGAAATGGGRGREVPVVAPGASAMQIDSSGEHISQQKYHDGHVVAPLGAEQAAEEDGDHLHGSRATTDHVGGGAPEPPSTAVLHENYVLESNFLEADSGTPTRGRSPRRSGGTSSAIRSSRTLPRSPDDDEGGPRLRPPFPAPLPRNLFGQVEDGEQDGAEQEQQDVVGIGRGGSRTSSMPPVLLGHAHEAATSFSKSSTRPLPEQVEMLAGLYDTRAGLEEIASDRRIEDENVGDQATYALNILLPHISNFQSAMQHNAKTDPRGLSRETKTFQHTDVVGLDLSKEVDKKKLCLQVSVLAFHIVCLPHGKLGYIIGQADASLGSMQVDLHSRSYNNLADHFSPDQHLGLVRPQEFEVLFFLDLFSDFRDVRQVAVKVTLPAHMLARQLYVQELSLIQSGDTWTGIATYLLSHPLRDRFILQFTDAAAGVDKTLWNVQMITEAFQQDLREGTTIAVAAGFGGGSAAALQAEDVAGVGSDVAPGAQAAQGGDGSTTPRGGGAAGGASSSLAAPPLSPRTPQQQIKRRGLLAVPGSSSPSPQAPFSGGSRAPHRTPGTAGTVSKTPNYMLQTPMSAVTFADDDLIRKRTNVMGNSQSAGLSRLSSTAQTNLISQINAEFLNHNDEGPGAAASAKVMKVHFGTQRLAVTYLGDSEALYDRLKTMWKISDPRPGQLLQTTQQQLSPPAGAPARRPLRADLWSKIWAVPNFRPPKSVANRHCQRLLFPGIKPVTPPADGPANTEDFEEKMGERLDKLLADGAIELKKVLDDYPFVCSNTDPAERTTPPPSDQERKQEREAVVRYFHALHHWHFHLANQHLRNSSVLVIFVRDGRAASHKAAHVEHDSSRIGVQQLIELAAELPRVDAVVLVGDTFVVEDEQKELENFLTEMQTRWYNDQFGIKAPEAEQAGPLAQKKSSSIFVLNALKWWESDQIMPMQFSRVQQIQVLDVLRERCGDLVHMGMRSGMLEPFALIGHKVVSMDELGSGGADRMIRFTETGDGLKFKKVQLHDPATPVGKQFVFLNRFWYFALQRAFFLLDQLFFVPTVLPRPEGTTAPSAAHGQEKHHQISDPTWLCKALEPLKRQTSWRIFGGPAEGRDCSSAEEGVTNDGCVQESRYLQQANKLPTEEDQKSATRYLEVAGEKKVLEANLKEINGDQSAGAALEELRNGIMKKLLKFETDRRDEFTTMWADVPATEKQEDEPGPAAPKAAKPKGKGKNKGRTSDDWTLLKRACSKYRKLDSELEATLNSLGYPMTATKTFQDLAAESVSVSTVRALATSLSTALELRMKDEVHLQSSMLMELNGLEAQLSGGPLQEASKKVSDWQQMNKNFIRNKLDRRAIQFVKSYSQLCDVETRTAATPTVTQQAASRVVIASAVEASRPGISLNDGIVDMGTTKIDELGWEVYSHGKNTNKQGDASTSLLPLREKKHNLLTSLREYVDSIPGYHEIMFGVYGRSEDEKYPMTAPAKGKPKPKLKKYPMINKADSGQFARPDDLDNNPYKQGFSRDDLARIGYAIDDSLKNQYGSPERLWRSASRVQRLALTEEKFLAKITNSFWKHSPPPNMSKDDYIENAKSWLKKHGTHKVMFPRLNRSVVELFQNKKAQNVRRIEADFQQFCEKFSRVRFMNFDGVDGGVEQDSRGPIYDYELCNWVFAPVQSSEEDLRAPELHAGAQEIFPADRDGEEEFKAVEDQLAGPEFQFDPQQQILQGGGDVDMGCLGEDQDFLTGGCRVNDYAEEAEAAGAEGEAESRGQAGVAADTPSTADVEMSEDVVDDENGFGFAAHVRQGLETLTGKEPSVVAFRLESPGLRLSPGRGAVGGAASSAAGSGEPWTGHSKRMADFSAPPSPDPFAPGPGRRGLRIRQNGDDDYPHVVGHLTFGDVKVGEKTDSSASRPGGASPTGRAASQHAEAAPGAAGEQQVQEGGGQYDREQGEHEQLQQDVALDSATRNMLASSFVEQSASPSQTPRRGTNSVRSPPAAPGRATSESSPTPALAAPQQGRATRLLESPTQLAARAAAGAGLDPHGNSGQIEFHQLAYGLELLHLRTMEKIAEGVLVKVTQLDEQSAAPAGVDSEMFFADPGSFELHTTIGDWRAAATLGDTELRRGGTRETRREREVLGFEQVIEKHISQMFIRFFFMQAGFCEPISVVQLASEGSDREMKYQVDLEKRKALQMSGTTGASPPAKCHELCLENPTCKYGSVLLEREEGAPEKDKWKCELFSEELRVEAAAETTGPEQAGEVQAGEGGEKGGKKVPNKSEKGKIKQDQKQKEGRHTRDAGKAEETEAQAAQRKEREEAATIKKQEQEKVSAERKKKTQFFQCDRAQNWVNGGKKNVIWGNPEGNRGRPVQRSGSSGGSGEGTPLAMPGSRP